MTHTDPAGLVTAIAAIITALAAWRRNGRKGK